MCFVLGGLRLASAQSSVTGAITGIVTDQSGAVIVGANVKVVNIANNAEVSTTTDSGGRFLAGLLQPSTYNVEVSAAGFGTHKYAAIIVEVGRSTTVDATLKPATTESVITTTAEAPVVETDRSDFSTNINAATMDNSPVNTRRWSTFALTTPGASADGTFGLISFRGISGLLNNNTVDGGDNNQAFFAEEKGRTRISYSISEDSVQEFQVNTSNYSAEYGRAAGGVVNAVTKSGTNHFHGTAYWYYRDSDIGATNPFTTQSILVNGVATIVPIKPPDRRHQFGGNLGGTIIKDKLFFFFNADQQLRNFPGVASPSSPAAFFSPLTASELSTLNGRGVSAAQANGAFSFLQTLTGNVSRRGDELILFPK
ncbi:MAG: carboxypeptidase regulatory-like domain-containing protein, partial [Terriglobales bacterium]